MRWCVLAVAILFASGPFWSSFAGFEPEDFPNPQVDPAIQPPGWAFSIWGLIYFGLLACAVTGAFLRKDAEDWTAHRIPLFLSLAVGSFWLPVSQSSPVAATVMIWIMLLTSIAALVKTPQTDRWLLRVPVALYSGWLTAASAISLGIVGPGFSFAFSDTTWTIVAFGAALFVAATVHLTLGRVPEYAAPLIWGLCAILIGAFGRDTLVAGLAAGSIVTIAVLVAFAPAIREGFSSAPDDQL